MEEIKVVAAQPAIVKACDMCRKKKIRCEPTKEGCAQCTKYSTLCHFTPISRRKKPRKPAGFKYISELQERIKKMEELVVGTIGQNGEKAGDIAQGKYATFSVINLEANDSAQSQSGLLHPPIATPSLPWQKADPEHHSLASTISRVAQAREENHALAMANLGPNPGVMSAQPSLSWKGSPALGPFSLPSFHELPSKPEALELVEETFRSLNAFFPLFDEQNFMQKFHANYLGSSPGKPSWWACINVVLSLAHRFRAMRALETAYENSQSCGYMQNALAVVSELNLLCHDLSAVQALIGMAIVLQGTPSPQASAVLISAALRLAQTMGLHRQIQDPTSFTEAQIEERRRVFWIAYFIDKDISLRTGLPFAQDDDEMDVELPMESSEERFGSYGLQPINFFNTRIGLAVIQGQIYKKLYSVHASRQSVAQKAVIAEELNSILSYWRSNVSIDFEDTSVTSLQSPLTIDFIHLIVLRFAYINCLIMIDRHVPPVEELSVPVGQEAQGNLIFSESICVVESRKAIRLVPIMPFGNYACVWLLLHPFFAAVTVLLQNVLRHPSSLQAQSDLRSVEPFLNLLESLASANEDCSRPYEPKRMHQACGGLYLRAKEFVERANVAIGLGDVSTGAVENKGGNWGDYLESLDVNTQGI